MFFLPPLFSPFIKGFSDWVEVSILHTAPQFYHQRNRCCAVSNYDYKFHQTFSIKIDGFFCCFFFLFVLFFSFSNHLDCFGGKLFLTSRARSICFIFLPPAHEEAKVTRATSGMPLFCVSYLVLDASVPLTPNQPPPTPPTPTRSPLFPT